MCASFWGHGQMTEENRSGPEFPGVSKTARDATLRPTQLASKFAWLEKRA